MMLRRLLRALRWLWSYAKRWRDVRRFSALLNQSDPRARRTRRAESAGGPSVVGRGSTGPAADTPEVARFLENASHYLFHSFGLYAIPAGYWSLLEKHRRPVESFARFVELLGVDVERVRARDEEALGRLRDYCEFLTLAGDDIGFLDRPARVEIARMIAEEDHEALRQALDRVARARLILATLDEPSPLACAAFELFLRDARATIRDPISAEEEALGALHAAAMEWRQTLAEAAAALAEAQASEETLAAQLGAGARLTSEERERRSRAADDLSSIRRRIRKEQDLAPEALRGFSVTLRAATALFDSLREAARARRAEEERAKREDARRRQEEEARRRKRRRSSEQEAGRWRKNYRDLDEALRFFGFAAGERPKWSDVQRRFAKLRRDAEVAYAETNDRSMNDRIRDAQSYFLEALRPNRARFA